MGLEEEWGKACQMPLWEPKWLKMTESLFQMDGFSGQMRKGPLSLGCRQDALRVLLLSGQSCCLLEFSVPT